MQVPLEWLLDESQEWPWPAERATAANLSDHELMHELAVRFRNSFIDFSSTVDAAENIDWSHVTREAEQAPPDKPFSPEVERAIRAYWSVQSKYMRWANDFDLGHFRAAHHESLPGADREIGEDEFPEPSFRLAHFEKRPDVHRFFDVVSQRPEYKDAAERRRLLSMRDELESVQKKRHDADRDRNMAKKKKPKS